ncbi:MAG: class I mannose-6-phosphate isomerase, partial [Sphingomonas sp.]
LEPRRVERVWGVTRLPAWSGGQSPADARIGEIWFEEPDGADRDLLVKLLFTSDRLSIQVHPDDAAARAIGHARGKDEAWLVLGAAPYSVIGLGLNRTVDREELRASALSGSIEQLIDWRPVRAGDIFYSPAGTIHAIGAGLTIMEIQQNLDLTYRLYDYGRPRELHLDAGLTAARPEPWRPRAAPRWISEGRELLHAGGAFVLERWTGDMARTIDGRDAGPWLIPVRDGGQIDGTPLSLGNVFRIENQARLAGDVALIAAYPGAAERPDLLF